MKNKIIPYNPKLKEFARKLRKEGIRSEIYLWKQIKNKSLGVEFHRQVPIDNYIVDFYCHELMLAIEIDGFTHKFSLVKQNDIVRQKRLESFGINFIRFDDNDVIANLDFVVNDIIKKINELKNIPLNPPSKGEVPSPY